MTKRKMFPLLIVLLCLGHLVFSQEYSYRHYTIKDGLPQSQITSIYQDSKGYMWIGTKAGLSRFDGMEFKNYHVTDGLSADFIEGMAEDTSNNLFVLTRNGYNKITEDTIVSFKLDTNLNLSWREKIVVDKDNALWAVLKSTDELVRFKNGNYSFINNLEMVPDSLRIRSTFYDRQKDRLYFDARADGIYYLHEDRLCQYWKPNRRMALRITQAPDGAIYGINKDSIYRVKKDTLVPITSCPIESTFWGIGDWDSRGRLYITNGQYKVLQFDGKKLEYLKGTFESTSSFCVDNEDNLWIGTETGVTKLISRKFLNFTQKNSGILPYIYSVVEDEDNNLYFASLNEGLVRYNGNEFEEIKGYRDIYPTDRFYMGAICDHNNNLILPTSRGALKYTGEDFYKIKGFKDYEAVLDIYEDPDNRAKLFGTEMGLVMREEDGTITRYPVNPGKSTGNVTTVVKDSANKYWIGGLNGLSCLKNDKIHHLPDSVYDYDEGAITLYRDYKENIWLGTKKGLYLYDYHSFRKIAEDKITSYVVSLTAVDSSKLVMGMISQMATLNLQDFYRKQEENINIYDHTNGFIGNECIQNSLFTDSEGNVWIPTSDKVVKFMPYKKGKIKHPPGIYIEKIKKLNQQMQWVTLHCNNKGDSVYEMPHTTNNLRFHYTGIDHSNPQGLRYQYKLEGNDDGWSGLTSARYATYTNLEPGKYTFRVKAYSSNDVWSGTPDRIKIHIQPALWQKTWLIVICIIAGTAGMAWLIYYYAHRHRLAKQRKAEYEKKMAEMKLLTVKNQLEPHFTFNALNSMAYVVLSKEHQAAYNYLCKLASMIRLSLEHSEYILRSLKDEIDFARHYLDIQKLRFDNHFDYEISIQDDVDMNFRVPKMIVHNYVENAIKHGIKHKKEKGFVKVALFKADEHLKIVVEDNGVGRKKAREIGNDSPGKGLKTLQEYCRIFNKYNTEKILMETEDLYDNMENPAGTKVTISIPLNYEYHVNDRQNK
ncbi:MAG: histidine kinase [Bacteroidales bacterium]|nr:histidine kinase [Bacteroidales bacterium]